MRSRLFVVISWMRMDRGKAWKSDHSYRSHRRSTSKSTHFSALRPLVRRAACKTMQWRTESFEASRGEEKRGCRGAQKRSCRAGRGGLPQPTDVSRLREQPLLERVVAGLDRFGLGRSRQHRLQRRGHGDAAADQRFDHAFELRRMRRRGVVVGSARTSTGCLGCSS